MTNRLLLLLLPLLLAGCGNGPMKFDLPKLDLLNSDTKRMTPEHLLQIKTAGVISFLEPQPRIHFVSSSLKESNIRPGNLPDWNINETIAGLMAGRLHQKGIAVVKIDPGMSVKDAYSSSASFAEPERIRDRLLAVGRAHNVDMLVVVYRQQVRDFVSKSSQKLSSYGLYKRHSEAGVYAYSTVMVEALSVKKGWVLGNSNAETKKPVNASVWQAKFETEEGPFRLQAARDEILEVVTNSALIAAQEAGLSN